MTQRARHPEEAVAFTALPPDLLVAIFKRVPDAAVSAVCKRFQHVCHTQATSVTFTRPYVIRHDDAFVATLAGLPQLARAHVPASARELRQVWNWPVSALTNLRRLSVPEHWPIDELPAEGSSLEVLEVESVTDDIEWIQAALDRVPAACALHAGVIFFGDGHNPPRPCHLIPAWAGRVRSARLEFETTDLSPSELEAVMSGVDHGHIEDIAFLVNSYGGHFNLPNVLDVLASPPRGLPQLTRLVLNLENMSSLAGLERAHLPKLASLRIACAALTSLCDLSLAGVTRLTSLQVDLSNLFQILDAPLPPAPHIASFDFVANAALSKLRSLVLTGIVPLRTLDALARHRANLGCLTSLEFHLCTELTDISALRDCGLTALQHLRICGCPALAQLDGITGAGLPQLAWLDLSSTGIVSLQGLRGSALATLRELTLRNCTALTTLDGLAGARLTSLSHIDVSYCRELRDLQGLAHAGIGKLHPLGLGVRGCTGLPKYAVEALKKMDPKYGIVVAAVPERR